MRKRLPAMTAYGITRWKNVLITMLFFNLSRKKPAKTKERLINLVRDQLPKDYDVETHFTPRYNPWDQRLCLVPDADLFAAIGNGSAEVVTDHIETFTEDGLKLKSGKTLPADIVVTATGLRMQLMSGMEVVVDGRTVDLAKGFSYKGMMFSDVPNLASAFGYTNASWTLKADLTSEYVCRLLNSLDRAGADYCVPRIDGAMEVAPWLDFSSGYVTRSMDQFPKQGLRKPWKVHQNYALDLVALRFGKVEDGVMEFGKKTGVKALPVKAAA
jgi:cation diffusion facilitator CzcD-associated flavoprotein CzcO